VLDTTDPRLPEWVIGHFSGEAWVVLGDDGQVLSTAVLKRYDDRLREISVGTAEAARGRGLAKAVTAAAARAVLAEGRAVLYNHDADEPQLGPGRRGGRPARVRPLPRGHHRHRPDPGSPTTQGLHLD
jgi:hypothetical protein